MDHIAINGLPPEGEPKEKTQDELGERGTLVCSRINPVTDPGGPMGGTKGLALHERPASVAAKVTRPPGADQPIGGAWV
jgi:hypothetical protein